MLCREATSCGSRRFRVYGDFQLVDAAAKSRNLVVCLFYDSSELTYGQAISLSRNSQTHPRATDFSFACLGRILLVLHVSFTLFGPCDRNFERVRHGFCILPFIGRVSFCCLWFHESLCIWVRRAGRRVG